jgi:hypothetical protein
MKTDSLSKRVRLLESKTPDEHDRRSREFLGKLSIEELHILHDIVERKESGIEPTSEEQAYCDAIMLKYSRTDDS